MKLLYAILLVVFIGACSHQPATQKEQAIKWYQSGVVTPDDYVYTDDETFSILSWNVEHFVDLHDDPYINNRREDNPEGMEPRISSLLAVLREADADLVVLQEFESAKFLRQLAKDSLSDMNYLYFADAPSHTWYMNVALMSRFPLGILNSYGKVTTPVLDYVDSTGVVETQNQINTRMWSIDVYPQKDYSFQLTGLHLKAGRGERNIGMRKGQIAFLKGQYERMILDDATRNMLIVGDLNALPGGEEINLLLAPDGQGNQFIDPLDPGVFTHPADSAVRRLDYILPNKNMEKEMVSVEVRYFYEPKKMRAISDHLPLVGIFKNKDADD